MKSASTHDRLAAQVPALLSELLGISLEHVQSGLAIPGHPDFVISADGRVFVVEFKVSTSAAQIALSARKLIARARLIQDDATPLLAVPFMGDVGRRLCEEAGLSWLDLSGNARIIVPGLKIIVNGQPNKFRGVGRPANLYAPQSSRLVRWLLLHPEQTFSQREIARATGMDEGFVSRLVKRLEREEYIIREPDQTFRPKDPALLLEDWRAAYRFEDHTVRRGHVAARSGDALLHIARDALVARNLDYAVTGLAAAWEFTRFAAFRIATFYLPADPPPAVLDALGFREDPRGANLWLVIPNDIGVFHGAVKKNDTRCVHPVQVYLDLKDHPERAPEAAERLRSEYLKWSHDDHKA